MLKLPGEGVRSSGAVHGAPLLHPGDRYFAALEHPFSVNGRLEDNQAVALCALAGLPHLEPAVMSFDYTAVLGTYTYVLKAEEHGISAVIRLVLSAHTHTHTSTDRSANTCREQAMLQHAFWDYLSDVRASPARPFLHYNSWFDFYSWQEPNATFADRAMDER